MYIKRELDLILSEHLDDNNIIIISGPRASGKTTCIKKLCSSVSSKHPAYYINLESHQNLEYLNESPQNLYKLIPYENGRRQYVFMDEIQLLDDQDRFLTVLSQSYRDKLKLVVTSDAPVKSKTYTGGNKKNFNIRPLTFSEFLNYKNPGLSRHSDEFDNLFFEYVKYGGYPQVVTENSVTQKEVVLEEIINSFINNDISRAGVRNNLKFYKLMKILAEKAGDTINMSEFASSLELSIPTIENYIRILRDKFFISTITPFSAGKYKKEVTKMPKAYYTDTGIRNAVLNNFANLPDRLDRDGYFENIVFNFLACKADSRKINFWRTQNKHEIDFIISRTRGFETRYSSQAFNPGKYKVFRKLYPDIRLDFVAHDRRANGCLGIFEI